MMAGPLTVAVESGDVVPIVAIVTAGFVGLVWAVLSVVQGIRRDRERERSRREIAAYIAEGSMTPEQGERLMNAGPRKADGDDED
ncbi:MAG: hypothetical protein JNJ48_07605 [Phycisphaerae bacterium]|nr:hypothetical protein [Phycisphaerae bacterium]